MNLILLTALVLSAAGAVLLKDLLKAGICLGILSILLSRLFFEMNSPYAAVFELSVCAGLITVMFSTVVSMTNDEDGTNK